MDSQAERRLWLMTLLRLAGFIVVLTGLWLAATSAGAVNRLAPGLLVMLAGLALFLAGPKYLLRHWRRQP